MRVRFCLAVCLLLMAGPALADAPLVVPPPREMKAGAGRVALPPEIAIAITPGAGDTERYAAETLAGDLRARFGRPTRVLDANDTAPAGVSIFLGRREQNALLWKLAAKEAGRPAPSLASVGAEGYALSLGGNKARPVVLLAGADASGVLYGALTLSQLFERRGADLVLPSPLEVRDWPALETRAYTGAPRDASPASLAALDWMARCRINAGYYEIYGDQGQKAAPLVVSSLVQECRRRGIRLYGCVSNWRTDRYLKRELCASNPEDVALVVGMFTSLAEQGCRHLVFLFDDLTQEAATHVERCAACRETFGDLAGTHAFWIRKMMEVGRRFQVQDFLYCPTPYYRGWEKSYQGRLDGVAYYQRLAREADLAGVQTYFCPFSRKEMEAAEKAGLRNPVWWQNGVYSLSGVSEAVKTMGLPWGGFPQVDWGWYGAPWKAGAGPVSSAETLQDLRTLPQRCRHAWLCAGGDATFAVWGAWAWAPARYDPAATEKALADALLGDGDAAAYSRIEGPVRKWVYRLSGAMPAGAGADQDSLLAELNQDCRQVQAALGDLKQRLGAQGQPAPATAGVPAHPPLPAAQRILGLLQADAAFLDAKREQVITGRVDVKAPALERRTEGDGARWESTMTLSSFASTYALRYAVHEEPAGVFRRCQWHFGSGLGKTAPSYRNWYDAGFIDVEVNGKSLEGCKAEFHRGSEDGGSGRLVGRWNGPAADVTLTFGLSRSGALLIAGRVAPKEELNSLRVLLWCIPSAGSGDWKDMDRWITTAGRSVQHPQKVNLDPAAEDWAIYYDKTYDLPREKAEGPCALLFDGAQVSAAEVDLADYVVTTALTYPKECRRFRLAVWDLHGSRNEDAIRRFREGTGRFGEELAACAPLER